MNMRNNIQQEQNFNLGKQKKENKISPNSSITHLCEILCETSKKKKNVDNIYEFIVKRRQFVLVSWAIQKTSVERMCDECG